MKKLSHGVCVPKAVGVGECTAPTGGRKQDDKFDMAESIGVVESMIMRRCTCVMNDWSSAALLDESRARVCI